MGHCFFFFVCTWKVEQKKRKISIFFLLRGGRNPSLLLLCIHAAEEEALTMSSPDIPFSTCGECWVGQILFFLHACPTWEVSPLLFSFLLFSALTLLPCKSPAKNMSFLPYTHSRFPDKKRERRARSFLFLKKKCGKVNTYIFSLRNIHLLFRRLSDKSRATIGSIKISFFAKKNRITGKYVCSCRNFVPSVGPMRGA